ncbi:DnaJA5-like protein [Pycnococcus provasolii]
MRCFYEVLGVPVDVDDDALRKAYRKAALKNHPDKHAIDERQAAEERFKEINNAFEVLSDPAERKWYDKHRTSILRGSERHQKGDGGQKEPPEGYVDVSRFFARGCFTAFDDTNKGFYTVYAECFAAIDEQEQRAWLYNEDISAKARARTNNQPPEAPAFGRSDASPESVINFYRHWQSFTTQLDFAWADIYDTRTAPDRRTRRAAEEENKKARRRARREYAESVEALVLFVKKRDPRYENAVAAIEERESARAAEAKARRDAEKARRYALMKESLVEEESEEEESEEEESEEEKSDDKNGVEEDVDALDAPAPANEAETEAQAQAHAEAGDGASNAPRVHFAEDTLPPAKPKKKKKEKVVLIDDDDDFDAAPAAASTDLWCEACRKWFKSEGAMANHVRSKKHNQAVEALRRRLEKEGLLDEDDVASMLRSSM